MKKLLSLLLALAMVFTLAACGGDGDSKKKDKDEEEGGIAGEYYLVSVEVNGKEMKAKILEKTYGEDCYIEIEEDGKATFYQLDQELDMEWEDDEIWYEDADDQKFELEINEKKGTLTITMEVDDQETVLSFEKESDEDDDEDDDDDDKKDKDKDKDEDETEGREEVAARPETVAPEYEDEDYPEIAEPSYYEEDATESTEPEYDYPSEEGPQVGDVYHFYCMSMNGETKYMEDLIEQVGEEEAYTAITLEITGDGECILTLQGKSADMEFDGSQIWPVEEPDDTADMEINGDKFSIFTTNYTLVFEK